MGWREVLAIYMLVTLFDQPSAGYHVGAANAWCASELGVTDQLDIFRRIDRDRTKLLDQLLEVGDRGRQ